MKSPENHNQFDDVHVTGEFASHLRPKDIVDIQQKLIAHGGEKIKDLEVTKTIIETNIIDFVRNEAEKIARSYAKEFMFDISDKNIHVMQRGGVRKVTRNILAVARPSRRQIFIDRDESTLEFAIGLFHEFMHVLAYNTITLDAYAKKRVFADSSQSGFLKFSPQDESMHHFELFEEGLVGYLTHKFYIQVASKHELFKDDAFAVAKLEQSIFVGREEEMNLVQQLVNFIWNKHHKQFHSPDDVWEVFLKARFSGDFEPARLLVEQTFGEGSFEKVGKADMKFFVDYIRKHNQDVRRGYMD
jgi:hypothetical protein